MAGNAGWAGPPADPIHEEIFQRFRLHYYWSTYRSEWATDIVFRKPEDLRRLYPLFVHHAMTTFHSPDVLWLLGKKLTAAGQVPGRVTAEVTRDRKRRQEGVRIKHPYNPNSVQLYDKAYTSLGSVLRAELTREDPEDFKVYRRPEGQPDGRWLGFGCGKASLICIAGWRSHKRPMGDISTPSPVWITAQVY